MGDSQQSSNDGAPAPLGCPSLSTMPVILGSSGSNMLSSSDSESLLSLLDSLERVILLRKPL